MSITDELRKWGYGFCGSSYEVVTTIADRIDAAHKKAMSEQPCTIDMVPMTDERMAEHGWIRLPKDADSEVIHVGDVMEYGQKRGRVIALMLANYPKKWGGSLHWAIQLEGEHAPTALDGLFRHYKPPTVEDLLSDFARLYDNIGGRENEAELWETLLAEYSAKLQLKEDSE